MMKCLYSATAICLKQARRRMRPRKYCRDQSSKCLLVPINGILSWLKYIKVSSRLKHSKKALKKLINVYRTLSNRLLLKQKSKEISHRLMLVLLKFVLQISSIKNKQKQSVKRRCRKELQLTRHVSMLNCR